MAGTTIDSEVRQLIQDCTERGQLNETWFIPKITNKIAQEANKAQTNGVAWAIGIIDELHIGTEYSDTTDKLMKGIKNTIRDRYKAETGVDPAPNYPIKVRLTADKEQVRNE